MECSDIESSIIKSSQTKGVNCDILARWYCITNAEGTVNSLAQHATWWWSNFLLTCRAWSWMGRTSSQYPWTEAVQDLIQGVILKGTLARCKREVSVTSRKKERKKKQNHADTQMGQFLRTGTPWIMDIHFRAFSENQTYQCSTWHLEWPWLRTSNSMLACKGRLRYMDVILSMTQKWLHYCGK